MYITMVSIYENVMQKVFAPISQYICKNCESKKLEIVGSEHNEEGIVSNLVIKCEECGKITKVIFNINNNGNEYIKGKIEE